MHRPAATILVIEDFGYVQKEHAALLARYAAKTYFSQNTDDALLLYRQIHPDLLIINSKQALDVYEALRKSLRPKHPLPPLITLIDKDADDLLYRLTEAACGTILFKPLLPEHLTRLLDSFLPGISPKDDTPAKETEHKFESFFHTIPEPAWIVDVKSGKIIDFNEANLAAYGYTHQEFAALSVSDLEVGESPDGVKEHIASLPQKKQATFPTRHRTKSGKILDVRVTIQKFRQSGRTLLNMICHDITEEKLQDEKFKIIFERANDGILATDLERGTFVFANPSMCIMLGYSEAELLTLGPKDIHPQTALPIILGIFDKQAKGEKLYAPELPLKRKDNTVIYADNSASRISSGDREYLVGIFRDVTERKMAEQSIREQLKIEKLVTEIAETFVNIDLETVDAEIDHALEKIGNQFKVDSGYIFLTREDGTTVDNVYEWCAPGIPPQQEQMQNIPLSDFPWSHAVFERQNPIVLENVALLPKEAAAERKLFAALKRQSVLMVPLFSENRLKGFIGFDTVNRKRAWNPSHINLLLTLGSIFVGSRERQQVFDKLQQTQHSLAKVQQIAGMGTFEYNYAAGTSCFSNELRKILGVSESEKNLSFDGYMEMLHPEDKKRLYTEHKRHIQNRKESVQTLVRFIRPDGRILYLSNTVGITYNTKGNPMMMNGIIHDVTKQHRMENELKERERQYRRIVEMTNTVPWRYDLLQKQYTYVGPQVRELWGYEAKNWEGADIQTWYERIHPDDRERARTFCKEETEAGRDHTLEFRALKPDGTVTWVKEDVSVVTADGKPTELIGYIFDITEQKKAELALKEKEALFRAVSENILAGIILYTRKQIGYANPAARDLLGYSLSDLVRHFHENSLDPNLQHIFDSEKDIHGKQNDLTLFYDSVEISAKNGETRWLMVETSAVTYLGKAARIAVFTDITTEKIARERLKETSKQLQQLNNTLEKRVEEEVEKNRYKEQMMLQQNRFAQMGEMISMIAHQWRQPLNAISATAINMRLDNKMGISNPHAAEEQTVFIEKQANKMSEIINDFMELFRPGKQQTKLRFADAVETVNKIIGAQMRSRDVAIVTDIPEDLAILGTMNELEHILLNLVANARDAFETQTTKEKWIAIQGHRRGREVILTVCDNAGGIPPEVLDRIFDAYFTTKQDGKGTGIGLYMTKIIIERNFGGTIEASNTKEGACFTITLQGET